MHQIPATVSDGIRKFLRLQQLPLQEYQLRQNADVFDLMDALTITSDSFTQTSRMLGKQMHQTSVYDPCEDVKRELENFLLVGKTERDTAHLRKKNLTMYHLILEPLIDSMAQYEHTSAIQEIDATVQQLIHDIQTFDNYGTEDDALVARHQIKAMVKQREDARRTKKEAAKKQARRKKRDDDTIPVEIDDEDTLVD